MFTVDQIKSLNELELQRSLLNLARMLSAHHGSKVVILVDEYDTPIQQGYSRGFYKKSNLFYAEFPFRRSGKALLGQHK